MAFLPLQQIDDLKIGLFIKLEGSWFSHPFPTNKFKIKGQKDLTILKGLKKVNILYDPEQSDSVAQEEAVEESDAPRAVGAIPVVPIPSEQETTLATPHEWLRDQERREAFEARRQQLRTAEQSYQEVLKQSKVMFQELRVGHTRALGKTTQMISSLGKIINDPGTSMALMNLMGSVEQGEDFFMHSLNVCTLSMMVGQEFKLGEDQLEWLGMGALFHDLGLLEYERGQKRFATSLSQSKVQSRKQHPEVGKDLAERLLGGANPSLEIIVQHHERLDGSGYPMGLTTTEIGLLSKIVAVVDEYDDLCNSPENTQSFTPYEALSYLYAKKRGVLWENAIVALVHMLSVYPPGSIVELSDGSYGVVSSINPHARMQPLVMLYAPDISREQALIIDLSKEQDLAITQNLRPKEVSKEIRDYLNPRRIISYFPSQPEPQPALLAESAGLA